MIDLRKLMSDDLGVDIDDDIISNDKIQNQWDRATKFWFTYKAKPEKLIGIVVDNTLIYTFIDPIPYSIINLYTLPEGSILSCSKYYYSKPILTVEEEGEYSVTYRGDLDITTTDEEDLEIHLRDLFVNYCKRTISQYLKFANYGDKTFEIDAAGWYSEAVSKISDLEAFIIKTRSEVTENISNLTNR